MTSVDVQSAGDDVSQNTVYRYPFKTLIAGGLAIGNPEIRIDDNGDRESICDGSFQTNYYGHYNNARIYRCFGSADLHLGIRELRSLRLIIAFSEHNLYLTAADAH